MALSRTMKIISLRSPSFAVALLLAPSMGFAAERSTSISGVSAIQQSAQIATPSGQNDPDRNDADRDDIGNHNPRPSQSAEIFTGSNEAGPEREMFERRSPNGGWDASANMSALLKPNNDAGSARSSGLASASHDLGAYK